MVNTPVLMVNTPVHCYFQSFEVLQAAVCARMHMRAEERASTRMYTCMHACVCDVLTGGQGCRCISGRRLIVAAICLGLHMGLRCMRRCSLTHLPRQEEERKDDACEP